MGNKPISGEKKLVSITILHRHGARGPGESELSPWDDASPSDVKRQWKHEEIEVLTPVGHEQIKTLGAWYAHRSKQVSDEASYFWRSSKSGRARESGEDFVQAFNATIGFDAYPKRAVPYEVDADNYFRPWKIFEAETKITKQLCMLQQGPWFEMALENQEFLRKIFHDVGGTKKTTKPITGALWSTTYLMAIKESEEFWKGEGEDERSALSKIITDEKEWERIESIALWVWEQRFFRHGFQRKIGGLICQEMLQRTIYNDGSVNIFSGHDYTLLSVLSNLLPSYSLNTPTSFGGYIMLELWEGAPPPHPGIGSCEQGPQSYSPASRTVRVIYNPCPFKNRDDHVCHDVQDYREEVIMELTLADAEAIIKDIDVYFSMLE